MISYIDSLADVGVGADLLDVVLCADHVRAVEAVDEEVPFVLLECLCKGGVGPAERVIQVTLERLVSPQQLLQILI